MSSGRSLEVVFQLCHVDGKQNLHVMRMTYICTYIWPVMNILTSENCLDVNMAPNPQHWRSSHRGHNVL